MSYRGYGFAKQTLCFLRLGALVKQTHRQSLFAEDCRRVPLGVPAPPTLRRGSFRPRHAGTGYSAVHRSPTTTPSQLKTTRWGLATPVTHKQSGSKRKLEDNEQSSSRSSGTSAKPQQPLKQKRTRKTPAKTKREKEHLKRDTIKYCKMIAARPPSWKCPVPGGALSALKACAPASLAASAIIAKRVLSKEAFTKATPRHADGSVRVWA